MSSLWDQLLPCSRREYFCSCDLDSMPCVLIVWRKVCKGKRKRLWNFHTPLFLAQHLEQEKHELRRRFENREGEWEGRVSELETDVKQLQDELERQQVHLREADREKTRAVQELSEQNQRLLDQLSRVSHKNLIVKYSKWEPISCTGRIHMKKPFWPPLHHPWNLLELIFFFLRDRFGNWTLAFEYGAQVLSTSITKESGTKSKVHD